MKKLNKNEKQEDFSILTDWEKEVLNKPSSEASQFLEEENQMIFDYIFEGDRISYFLYMKFDTFLLQMGEFLLDQFRESSINRLNEFGLELSDAVNYGLIRFKIEYENFHRASYGEIMGYEKLVINIKQNNRKKGRKNKVLSNALIDSPNKFKDIHSKIKSENKNDKSGLFLNQFMKYVIDKQSKSSDELFKDIHIENLGRDAICSHTTITTAGLHIALNTMDRLSLELYHSAHSDNDFDFNEYNLIKDVCATYLSKIEIDYYHKYDNNKIFHIGKITYDPICSNNAYIELTSEIHEILVEYAVNSTYGRFNSYL